MSGLFTNLEKKEKECNGKRGKKAIQG
jgi:hypothetical protein